MPRFCAVTKENQWLSTRLANNRLTAQFYAENSKNIQNKGIFDYSKAAIDTGVKVTHTSLSMEGSKLLRREKNPPRPPSVKDYNRTAAWTAASNTHTHTQQSIIVCYLNAKTSAFLRKCFCFDVSAIPTLFEMLRSSTIVFVFNRTLFCAWAFLQKRNKVFSKKKTSSSRVFFLLHCFCLKFFLVYRKCNTSAAYFVFNWILLLLTEYCAVFNGCRLAYIRPVFFLSSCCFFLLRHRMMLIVISVVVV